jgi:hypothetical protein
MNAHDDLHYPTMPRRVLRTCDVSEPTLATSDFAGSWK